MCLRLRPIAKIANTPQGFTGNKKIELTEYDHSIFLIQQKVMSIETEKANDIMLDKANQIPFQILTHKCHTAMHPAQRRSNKNIKY